MMMVREGDKAENPEKRRLFYDIAKDYFRFDAISQLSPEQIGALHVGDIYNTKDSQVGAMGSGSKAEGNTFVQVSAQGPEGLDLPKLAAELTAVAQKLVESKPSPQQIAAAGIVATAQMAAAKRDGVGVLEALSKADEHVLEVAHVVGAFETAEAMRRAGIVTDIEREKIRPWAQLPHQEFLVEDEKLGDLVLQKILRNLEWYGICQFRLAGQAASVEVVESLITMLGPPTEWQNEAAGPIKDIRPKEGVDPNTGDSKGDLGFHVDGTQAAEQPPVLLFQYATGATLGGHSRFVDAARIMLDIPQEQRHQLLINLARPDAGTFEKRDMSYQGPIVSFSPAGYLQLRVRFDEVLHVNETCREDFELLKEKFNDQYYPTVFQPRDADIVVFDNLRVMHARTEVYGTRQRHHRRVWYKNLKLEHQPNYLLGIRPISREVSAAIERMNTGR
jgi:alpha-ketoglutarate-dependent taurine dioxygenase